MDVAANRCHFNPSFLGPTPLTNDESLFPDRHVDSPEWTCNYYGAPADGTNLGPRAPQKPPTHSQYDFILYGIFPPPSPSVRSSVCLSIRLPVDFALSVVVGCATSIAPECFLTLEPPSRESRWKICIYVCVDMCMMCTCLSSFLVLARDRKGCGSREASKWGLRYGDASLFNASIRWLDGICQLGGIHNRHVFLTSYVNPANKFGSWTGSNDVSSGSHLWNCEDCRFKFQKQIRGVKCCRKSNWRFFFPR